MSKRILLAMTGASGMPYALALIEGLRQAGAESHLILSEPARKVLALETDRAPAELEALVHAVHDPADFAAPPASGSWPLDGMVVCPCSMASLAAIAHGVGRNLIHRAADVCLKERRPLVLVPRETPLNRAHLSNMLAAHDAGAIILPAAPGFYHRPASIDELARGLAGRILDQLDIPQDMARPWTGPTQPSTPRGES